MCRSVPNIYSLDLNVSFCKSILMLKYQFFNLIFKRYKVAYCIKVLANKKKGLNEQCKTTILCQTHHAWLMNNLLGYLIN